MTSRRSSFTRGGLGWIVLAGAMVLAPASGRAQQFVASRPSAIDENRAGIETALVLGPGKSLKDARKWFERAAVQGYAPAQVNLAIFYINGWGGGSPNYGSALYWLKSAAQQGQPRAYTNLGILYLNGWGVAKDYSEAMKDFRFAAEHGEMGAMVNVGYMTEKGMGTAVDQAGAAEWYRRAAEQGDGLGQNNLADSYLRGIGVAQNDELAALWFQRAADQGQTAARIKLGYLYMVGRGLKKDPAAAYSLILAASLGGDHRGDEYLPSLREQLTAEQVEQATRRAQELQARASRPITETAFVQ